MGFKYSGTALKTPSWIGGGDREGEAAGYSVDFADEPIILFISKFEGYLVSSRILAAHTEASTLTIKRTYANASRF